MIKELEQISVMIRARYPIIYIVSSEEVRVINNLKKVFEEQRKLYIWSETSGFKDYDNYLKFSGNQLSHPDEALEVITENNEKAIFILNDFHNFLNEDSDHEIIRRLRELSEALKKSTKNIILISPVLKIPSSLEKEIAVIDFPLPNQEEITSIFEESCKVAEKNNLDIDLDEEKVEQIIKALKGLSFNEIENVLYKSLVERNDFLLEVFLKEKEQTIRKTGFLEYFHSKEHLDNVGGLVELKSWIIKRKHAFKDKAREFGLPYPKGLLLIGVQGCGKSLCCKVISNLWNFPLLRLDVGSIFQGIVGSSENNIRKAISIAESIAPCILWIDEIEKGFSGVKSSDTSDAGTTARVFSTFLTWMQEKDVPVFIVATANDIRALPPELMRKGRFDEIFFIDLPNEMERKEIFEIHLRKRNRDPASFNLNELVKSSNKFSGAEIESAIISALYDAYDERISNADYNANLETRHIIKALEDIVPLSVTLETEIKNLRQWAKNKARFGSKSKERTKKEIRNIDLK